MLAASIDGFLLLRANFSIVSLFFCLIPLLFVANKFLFFFLLYVYFRLLNCVYLMSYVLQFVLLLV